MKKLNKFRRTNLHMKIWEIFPKKKGLCACGCDRKTNEWFAKECAQEARKRAQVIRYEHIKVREIIFHRDSGICNKCGNQDDEWQVDHIKPVMMGGGACEIDNLQTLCKKCHEIKTSLDWAEKAMATGGQ